MSSSSTATRAAVAPAGGSSRTSPPFCASAEPLRLPQLAERPDRRCPTAVEALVDVDAVDLEGGRFQAARHVVGGATLIRGRVSPDAEFLASALDHAPPLVLGDVPAG